jgi:hypothetical protein
MCHADNQWTEALPLVLLSIQTAYKEDLKSSVAELVYGERLRAPGKLLVPTTQKIETSAFIQQRRRCMDQLRPIPAARHSTRASFMHRDLKNSTHILLRQDAFHRTLEPPYRGPHRVTARTEKTFKIVVSEWQVTMSAERVKLAFILAEGQHNSNISPPVQPRNVPAPPPRTTRSGRSVRFPAYFTT